MRLADRFIVQLFKCVHFSQWTDISSWLWDLWLCACDDTSVTVVIRVKEVDFVTQGKWSQYGTDKRLRVIQTSSSLSIGGRESETKLYGHWLEGQQFSKHLS